jgi:hypothetical protein
MHDSRTIFGFFSSLKIDCALFVHGTFSGKHDRERSYCVLHVLVEVNIGADRVENKLLFPLAQLLMTWFIVHRMHLVALDERAGCVRGGIM